MRLNSHMSKAESRIEQGNRKPKSRSCKLCEYMYMWSAETEITYMEADLKIFKGTIARSPTYFSHAIKIMASTGDRTKHYRNLSVGLLFRKMN